MARARIQGTVRLVGVARRTRSALLVSTALQAVVAMVLAVPAEAQPAPNARPTGGVVVGGSAAISQTTNNTAINQASQRAAINWQGFDVGSKQSVTFQQPNAQAITLNTVTGPNPSRIAGRINANGQVVLVNQSGVTFYKGSQVNTAGLMVSAVGANTAQFMAGGKIVFDRPGNPNARIINNGNITIRDAGLAALVAPSVANAGVIDAKLGHVVLAGAKTATLDLYGDKLVSVNVTGAVTQAPDGVASLVTNTGVVRADGGTVRLTARAVDGVVTDLVSAGGTIRARTVGDQQGRITIDGVGGSITVSGNVDATGKTPGMKGGRIGLLATDSVIVKSGAVVNTSGAAGGGTVAIGTTLKRAQGGPAVTGARMAKRTVVEAGAAIAANATVNGNGGRVVLLSSDTTKMGGTITATGGLLGGDGGFVEVSGKNLGITGQVTALAPEGKLGTILLDPDFLNVVNQAAGGSQDVTFLLGGTVLATDPPAGTAAAPETISNTVISGFGGNVLLQANQTLTVAGNITLTKNAGQNLVLEAGGTVNVNNTIKITASGDVIVATGGAGPSSPPTAQSSPLISLLGTITSTGGSVSLLSGAGGSISIGTQGSILVSTTGKLATLQTDTLTVTNSSQVNVTNGTIEIAPASAVAMHLGGAGGLAISQTAVNAMNSDTLRLGGATVGGAIVTTATAIAVDGAINLSGVKPTLDLRTSGAITQSAALTNVGTLAGNAGTVTLTNTGNSVGTIGAVAATSGFTLVSGGGLTVAGTLATTGGDAVLTSTGGGSSVDIKSGGAVTVPGANTASFRADKFSNAGTVTGGVFEYAPNSGGLKAGKNGNIVDLTGIGSTLIRLGQAAGAITATGITTGGTFDLANGGVARALDLRATGTVTDAGGGFLNVSTLTGTVSGGPVSLTASGIDTVGGFTVSGGGNKFTLQQPTGTLTVAGPLVAAGVTLASGNITVPGTISTGGTTSGAVSLTANTGTISGAGAVIAQTLSGSAVTTVNLPGLNQVGTLGKFNATGFTFNNSIALSVGDTISAATINLTATSIDIPGLLNDGGAGTVNLVATTGAITEPGAIAAGTLTGSAATSANFAGATPTTNQIANLGTFAASNGTIGLNDGLALAVIGSVSATGSVALQSATTVTVNTGNTVSGSSIVLIGSDIVVNGTLNTAGLANLMAATGSISDTGAIIAGRFGGTAGTSADLGGATSASNQIGSLGPFNSNNGSLALRDGLSLTVVNDVSASGTITLISDGLLTVSSGKAVTAAGISLTGSTGVTIDGLVDGTGGLVNLVSATGPITETGTILATTLTGNAGGLVNLQGTAPATNQITNIGVFTAGTGFSLRDGTSLNGTGAVTATTGDVVVHVAGAGNKLTLSDPGTLTAPGTVSVQADQLVLAGSGTIIAGTFEYAQDTAGPMTVGTGGGTIVDLTGIAAPAVRLGAVRGGAPTATSITFKQDFDAGAGAGGSAALDLRSTGSIDAGNRDLLNVTTLTGGATGPVTLGSLNNTVGTLGDFSAGTVFTLGDASALSVTGKVSAGAVTLTAASIDIPGSITTGSNAIGTVSLTANTTSVGGTGSITTGDLSGTAVTTFNLSGNNQVGALSGATGTAVTLNDVSALSITNTVSAAGAVVLTSGDLLTIGAGKTVTGANVTLTGTALAISGLASAAGTLDLNATKSGITEIGTIGAGTLTGTTAGSALLTSANNQIVNLGAFTASSGTISIVDAIALNVTGKVSATAGDVILRSAPGVAVLTTGTLASAASTGTVSVRTDAFSIAGAGTITGGVFEFATDTAGLLKIGTGGAIVDLTGIGSSLVRLGSAQGAITADGLTLTSNLDLGVGNGGAARALDLRSTISIDEGANALLNVTTLAGVANTGSVGLGNVLNSVTALGSFVIGTGFTFADSIDLTIANVLSAAPISLTAPNITISGTINTGGSAVSSTTLIANAGTIRETGGGQIVTGTLTGSSVGTATLSGSNQIGNLGSFGVTTGDFVLSNAGDTGNLTVSGPVTAANVAISNANTGTITVTGSIGATTALALASGSGGIQLTTGEILSGATVDLSAAGGGVTQIGTGTIVASSLLTSTSGVTGTVNLGAVANSIASVGSFAVNSGDFVLANNGNAGNLTLSGPLTAANVTIGNANTGTITVIGSVGATTALKLSSGSGGIHLNAGDILSGATVDLSATGGGVAQVASGTITASSLLTSTAGVTGTVDLAGTANNIAAIGSFAVTGGDFILVDNGNTGNLAVTGPVSANGPGALGSIGISNANTGTISVGGSLHAAAGILLASGSGGVHLNNGASLVATTVDLSAAGGGVTEVATVGIVATSLLRSTGGVTGGASLAGNNAIAGLGSFIVTGGTFSLNNAIAMTVSGPLSATGVAIQDNGSLTVTGPITATAGNVVLGSTDPGGITINGGAVIATGNTVSVSAASLAFAGGGAISTDTFEFGPAFAGGTVTLGGGGFGLGGIGAANIRIGKVSGAVVAGSIVIAGFDAGTHPIELDATGAVTQTGALTNVTTLTGTAGSYTLTNASNTIDQIGGGTLSTTGNGAIRIFDAKALTVAGLVSAGTGTVDLSTSGAFSISQGAGGTLIAGVLTSGSGIGGTLSLLGSANQIGTITGLTAAGLTVVDSTGLDLAGVVSVGAGTVDITTASGSLTQGAGARLVAGVLTSTGGIAGNVSLLGTANQIGSISGLTASGGALTIVDNTSLALAGVVSVGAAGTVDITTTGGGSLAQGAGAQLIAGVLTSNGGIAGNASLLGVSNRIGTLTNLNAAGGSLALVDSQSLTLAGTISGLTSVNISTSGGGDVTQGAGATLLAGTFGGVVAGTVTLAGTLNQIGTIAGFSGAGLTVVDSNSLVLAGLVGVGAAGTVDITISGGGSLAQGAAGTLIAGVLTSTGGIGGNISLQGTANQIGSVFGVAASGGLLTLVGSSPMTLAGLVSVGANGTIDISTTGGASVTQGAGAQLITGLLTSTGGISGTASLLGATNQIGTIGALTAAGLTVVDTKTLTLAGLVSAGAGTIDITTTGGASLTQASGGTLVAGLLTSSGGISGTAILLGSANQIGTLGNFTATGSLVVVDGTAMTIAGADGASAGNVFVTTGANTLTFTAGGALKSNGNGTGTIGIEADGLSNLGVTGATGIVDAGANGVFEFAPATTTKTVTLGAAVGPSLSTVDGITAGTLRIGQITQPVSGTPVLNAASIVVGGKFDMATIGTLDLESKGGIGETVGASVVNLGSLIASTNGAAGDINLGSTLNVIGTIANISVPAGDFIFGDTPASGAFAVKAGQTIAANNVAMTILGTLSVAGSITAAAATGNVSLTTKGGAADLLVATGALVSSKATTSLTAGRDLLMTGGLINGGTVAMTAAGLVSAGGSVSASAVSLTGANVAIPGTVTDGGAGTVSLIATGGTVDETGTLIAGTLTGGSTGATTLTGKTTTINQVATIGNFTAAGGFQLNDGTSVTVIGALSGGPSATILDSASISVAGAGSVTATTVSLKGTDVTIAGLVSGSAGVDLIATAGTIGESGTLATGALTGSSTGATTLSGKTVTANQVSGIGDFTAAGGFSLNDGLGVTVTGALNGGPSVALQDSGALSVASGGSVIATVVTLTGLNLTLGGLVNGSSTVGLIATGGTISESGTLIAGTLSGSSTAATLLNGTANQVATLGGFSAAGFTLTDSVSLSVAGVVNGGGSATITDTKGLSIAVGGTVAATAVNLTGTTVSVAGLVTDGGAGILSLTATGGGIDDSGTIIGGAVTLSATGGIAETGAGVLTAASFSGGSGLATVLGNVANSVTTIGNFTASGFTLNDAAGLTVTGVINGGTAVAITDTKSLSVAGGGTVAAGSVSLLGTTVSIAGLVSDGGAGTINLNATAGGIDDSGTINGGAVTLTATGGGITASGSITGVAVTLTATGGGITETGALTAATLTGSSTGATSLTGATPTTNQVTTLGNFSAAGFSLLNGIGLSVAGVVNGGSSVMITDSAALTVLTGGTVTATAVNLTGATVSVAGLVTDGGAGVISLTATGGGIDDSGAIIGGTVTLAALGGGITESGALTAVTLTGSSAGATNLAGATTTTNQIATLGNFTAAGFTLNDAANLAVAGVLNGGTSATIVDANGLSISGAVTASAVSLTGTTLSIAGLVDAGVGGTVSLTATTGAIDESGTLIAGTLSGSSAGATILNGVGATTNQIGNLGGFTASGFTLRDGASLSITGALNGGAGVTIIGADALLVPGSGSVTGTAISLTGTTIGISGLVTDGGSGTVSLTATSGAISETGTLIAGTLSGSSTSATTLAGATPTTNQIATLADFAASGFSLSDGIGLAVTGNLNGGASATILDSASLAIRGGVSAAAVSLTGANITITGTVTDGGAGTVSLIATSGTIGEPSGTIIAGTLSGSSTGATNLTGSALANQIATLGNFSAAGFTFVNAANLTLSGTIAAGPTLSFSEAGALIVAGGASLSAGNVTIQASGGATILGSVTSTGTAAITTPASLVISGALNAAGNITLSSGDFIAGGTIASSAGSIVATNKGTVSVTGLISGQTGVSISDSPTGFGSVPMTVAGTILSAAGAVTISDTTLGAFSLSGLISGKSGVTISDSGDVTVSGSIVSSAGTVGLAGLGAMTIGGGINGQTGISVTDTGAMTVSGSGAIVSGAGGVSIIDGGAFSLSGLISGKSGVTISDSGDVTVAGSIVSSAGTVGLSGLGTMTIGGGINGQTGVSITDTGAMTVSGSGAIVSGAGGVSITDGGAFSLAGLISGRSGVSITGSGDVTVSGSIISASGAAGLSGIGAMAISGVISGQTGVTITDTGTMSVTGTGRVVSAGGGVSITDSGAFSVAGLISGQTFVTIADGALLTVSGSVTAQAVSLTGSGVAISGLVSDGGAGTVSLIATSGTINETGTVIAGTLSGKSTGATTLLGATPVTNQIGTLGAFSAAGFTLNDGKALTVSGAVNGGTAATFTDSGLLSVTGAISATAVSLTAASIAIPGLVTDGGAGTVSLIATSGSITETGTLIAGSLSGTSTGATTLTGASGAVNQVATITGFTAASFALNNNKSLLISGPINAGAAFTLNNAGGLTIASGASVGAVAIGIVDIGDMAINGNVAASGTATISNQGGTLNVPGNLTAGTGLSITGNGNMTVAGNIVSNGGTVGIIEIGALTVPGLISGQTGVTIADTGAMTVAGNILSAGGTVGITDTGPLNVTGNIRGQGGVTGFVTAGDFILPGTISSALGTVTLSDTGAFTLSNTSSISAGTTITITDTNLMTLAGVLSGPKIVVDNGAGNSTILAGTQIQTGGTQRPAGSIPDTQLPSATTSNLGFFMTTGALIQNGTLTITGTPGTPGNQPTIVRFDASSGLQFANVPGGIVGPDTWLILGLSNTNTKATGGVTVANLDTAFTGQTGGASLNGTVGGLSGNAAAGAAHIAPNTNSAFQINGCPIASVNCVLLTTQGIPAASPLRDFVFGSIFNPTDDDDLLLPLVSDEVY